MLESNRAFEDNLEKVINGISNRIKEFNIDKNVVNISNSILIFDEHKKEVLNRIRKLLEENRDKYSSFLDRLTKSNIQEMHETNTGEIYVINIPLDDMIKRSIYREALYDNVGSQNPQELNYEIHKYLVLDLRIILSYTDFLIDVFADRVRDGKLKDGFGKKEGHIQTINFLLDFLSQELPKMDGEQRTLFREYQKLIEDNLKTLENPEYIKVISNYRELQNSISRLNAEIEIMRKVEPTFIPRLKA
ncbi:MAG: hypothetical protein QXM92_00225 [Candidatus Anstonellales archaeon]